MRSRLVLPVIVVASSLLAVGCGGPPQISDVKSCLKDAKLNVDSAGKNDPSVKEGVSGTSDLTDEGKMVLAVAAVTKTSKDVAKFEKQTKELTQQLSQSAAQKDKMKIDSGTDGDYVWVVAGAKGTDKYDAARGCVQP